MRLCGAMLMLASALVAQRAFGEEAVKPPVFDAPFIISYWCGPPKSETTLARYKEIADCGFNVAFPAIDMLWSPSDKAGEAHNHKYLDLCKQVGIKALVWDGSIPKGGCSCWRASKGV